MPAIPCVGVFPNLAEESVTPPPFNLTKVRTLRSGCLLLCTYDALGCGSDSDRVLRGGRSQRHTSSVGDGAKAASLMARMYDPI
eukprot:4171833-Amphidinium_carterae.2